jgi:DNA-binding GntR family transcriptional regulator
LKELAVRKTDNPNRIQLALLNDECYRRIKDSILCGDMTWGSRIDVNKLAESYEISKFPVIKALERLSLEGLVEVYPNKGTFVVDPKIEDINEVTEIRIILEQAACQRCYHHHYKELISRLHKLENMYSEDERTNYCNIPFKEFLEYDRNFHLTFIQLVHSERLSSYYQVIRSQAELFRTKTFFENNIAEAFHMHRRIYTSLVEADLDGALDSIRKHLE